MGHKSSSMWFISYFSPVFFPIYTAQLFREKVSYRLIWKVILEWIGPCLCTLKLSLNPRGVPIRSFKSEWMELIRFHEQFRSMRQLKTAFIGKEAKTFFRSTNTCTNSFSDSKLFESMFAHLKLVVRWTVLHRIHIGFLEVFRPNVLLGVCIRERLIIFLQCQREKLIDCWWGLYLNLFFCRCWLQPHQAKGEVGRNSVLIFIKDI